MGDTAATGRKNHKGQEGQIRLLVKWRRTKGERSGSADVSP